MSATAAQHQLELELAWTKFKDKSFLLVSKHTFYDRSSTNNFVPPLPLTSFLSKELTRMRKTSNEKDSHSNGEKDSWEHGFPAGLSNLQAFTFSFSHQRSYSHRPCPRDRHLDCIKLPGGMCAKLQYETIKKAAYLLFLWFVRKVIV